MKINNLNAESTLVAHLSKNDLKFFEKNPFQNIMTGSNNKGIKIIFSLGEKMVASLNGNIISVTATKKNLTFLLEGGSPIFFLINMKNPFYLSAIEVYLEID